LKVKLKFNELSKDKISVKIKKWTLPSGMVPTDVTVDVGGAAFTGTLDAKGKFKSLDGRDAIKMKQSKKTQLWKIKVKRKNNDFAADLADDGLTDADNPKPGLLVTVPLTIEVGGATYRQDVNLRYKSKLGKLGKARRSSGSSLIQEDAPTPPTGPVIDSGGFSVLTYNVAGLPEIFAGSAPSVNHPKISPLLDEYDVPLVQEDFCHHDLLAADVDLDYQSDPQFDPPCTEPDRIGDGLNRFSDFSFASFTRVPWTDCSGELDCKSDCLTPKGYTFARHTVAPGAVIDFYNIHTDSGSCRKDIEVRGKQVLQLLDGIRIRSSGNAVIVVGDTNLKVARPGDGPVLDRLLETAVLRDACREVSCGDERLDRIMVRSSDNLVLTVAEWTIADEFVDEEGQDLSDHLAVAAEIEWELH
jgi:endonuclease/exonuclease/phosphatase family metal-dependent hydrolase